RYVKGSVADPDGSPAEPIVDPGLHHLDALANVGIENDLVGGVGELHRAGREIEVVVFDLGGPVVGEGIFRAGAYDPAPPGFVGVEVQDRRGGLIFVVDPGGAAFAVEEEAIEGDAQPAGDRTHRVDLGAAVRRQGDGDDDRRAVGVAGEIAPACTPLDAEHPRAGLILRADLAAGEPAARIDGGRYRRVGHAAA